MTRQAYIDQETSSLLFWSPKSGCTSLVQWFTFGRLGMQPEEIRASGKDARGWLRQEGYRADFREARKLVNQRNYKSIALVRHPASRVLSAFLNKFVTYNGKSIDAWDKHEMIVRKEIRKWGLAGENGEGFEGISFRQFLNKIEEKVEAAKDGEPQLDGHWNTQMPHGFARNNFAYDKLLYLEASDKAVEWLNAYFGVAYKTPKTNRTSYSEASETVDATDIPSYELSAHPEWLKKENFLHKDILEQIHRIYRFDYEAFGYDPYDLKMVPDTDNGMEPVTAVPATVAEQGADDTAPYEIHDNGATKTVVAFGGLGQQLGMPVFEFRRALFELDCNFVFLRDINRSWYHHNIEGFGDSFEEKGQNLKAILGRLADTEIYTLGSSAGGFAALMFSAFLNTKASLLFGPQVFIDKPTRRLLADQRWPRLMKQITSDDYLSVRDVAGRINHPVHFVVGNKDDLDMRHALFARAYIDAHINVLTGGGHNPAGELKKAGILNSVLSDFVDGKHIKPHATLHMPDRRAALKPLP